MKATIQISDRQLEALNRLVSMGFSTLDPELAEECPAVEAAHAWLNRAHQALVRAQEQESADAFIGPMFDKARKAAEEAVADAREAGWSENRIDRLEDSVFHHAMGEQL